MNNVKMFFMFVFCFGCSVAISVPSEPKTDHSTVAQEHNTVRYYPDRIEYMHDGIVSRTNGPAIIFNNGRKVWCTNGGCYKEFSGGFYVLHSTPMQRKDFVNVNDPVYCEVDSAKTKRCYKNSQLHRDGDPAVVYANGKSEWYQNGVFEHYVWVYKCNEDKSECLVKYSDLEREVYSKCKSANLDHCEIHRTGGPAIVVKTKTDYSDWHITQEWWVDGKRHREDGPAIINRTKFSYNGIWYFEGVIYRSDGPSVIEYSNDSHTECWVNNNTMQKCLYDNGICKASFNQYGEPDYNHNCLVNNANWAFFENDKLSYCNLKDGTKTYFNDDGEIDHAEKKIGETTVYYDSTGHIDHTDGPYQYNKDFEGWYKNGKLYKSRQLSTGTILTFNNDGNIVDSSGPVVVDQTKMWWSKGKITKAQLQDGTIFWFDSNGKITKEQTPYGTTIYRDINGNISKSEGPVIDDDGTKKWFKNGKIYQFEHQGRLVRVTGDAYSYTDEDGSVVKCTNRKCVSTSVSGEKTVLHLDANVVQVIDVNGVVQWFKDGERYRIDIPGRPSIYE